VNSYLQVGPEGFEKAARFLKNGLFNTAMGYGIYSGLLVIDVTYFYAAPTSFVLGTLFAYLTSSRFVFKKKLSHKTLIRFFICYGFLMLLNLTLVSLLVAISLNAYVAGFLAIICHAVLGFLVLNNWVFRTN